MQHIRRPGAAGRPAKPAPPGRRRPRSANRGARVGSPRLPPARLPRSPCAAAPLRSAARCSACDDVEAARRRERQDHAVAEPWHRRHVNAARGGVETGTCAERHWRLLAAVAPEMFGRAAPAGAARCGARGRGHMAPAARGDREAHVGPSGDSQLRLVGILVDHIRWKKRGNSEVPSGPVACVRHRLSTVPGCMAQGSWVPPRPSGAWHSGVTAVCRSRNTPRQCPLGRHTQPWKAGARDMVL